MDLDDNQQIQESLQAWKHHFTSKAFDPKAAIKGINWLYDFLDKPKPIVLIANSPLQARLILRELFTEKNLANTDLTGLHPISHGFIGRASYLEFFQKRGTLRNPDLQSYIDLMHAGIMFGFFYEGIAIISKPPVRYNPTMHDVNNPCAVFEDGWTVYFVNGIPISETYIKDPITAQKILHESGKWKEFLKLQMLLIVKERYGNKHLMNMFPHHLVDQCAIEHSSPSLEDTQYKEIIKLYKSDSKFKLLRTHLGKANQPLCWLVLVCPSTGDQHVLECSSHFDSALDAIKFLRPDFVHHSIAYNWKLFAN